jgi:thiol-disulfide isomerase/thioredoxin
MNGHKQRSISFFIGAVVVLTGAAFAFAAAPGPNLSLVDDSGHPQSLSDYRGKIVVLNFWATWCPPCREELPMLNKLSKDYAAKNVIFIAAAIDDAQTKDKIPSFLKKKKITLPVWVGASPDTLKQFDLGGIVPATIILDQNGETIARIMGEARQKDITSRLDWLLDGREGKQPKSVLKRY